MGIAWGFPFFLTHTYTHTPPPRTFLSLNCRPLPLGQLGSTFAVGYRWAELEERPHLWGQVVRFAPDGWLAWWAVKRKRGAVWAPYFTPRMVLGPSAPVEVALPVWMES